MDSKQYLNRFFVRLDKDEEIVENLKNFCKKNQIESGFLLGIGTVNNVTLQFYNKNTKNYDKKVFTGDYELIGLNGNITVQNGENVLHMHVNIADNEFKTFGGHLDKAYTTMTCEIVVVQFESPLEREFDSTTNLNLLKF